MLENMRHFQQVALDAEKVIDGLTAVQITGKEMSPEEQFKVLLAQVKRAAGVRHMAHECARDAAPFMHPRLASTQISGNPESPIEVIERIERVIVEADPQDRDAAGVPPASDAKKV
jgi:hypothetical protein